MIILNRIGGSKMVIDVEKEQVKKMKEDFSFIKECL